MTGSKYTKKCRIKYWLASVLNALLMLVPLATYVGIAMTDGGVTTAQKIGVTGTVLIAILFTGLNVILQKHLRCPIWIVLLGLFIAMQKAILPLIIILAVVSVLDDLLFTPLTQYYKTKLIAAKAMDEREVENNN
jgi:hypothetical protein